MDAKIRYEKPTAVSLGEVGPMMEGACSPAGDNPASGAYCPNGNVADQNCVSGGTAGAYCGAGSNPSLTGSPP